LTNVSDCATVVFMEASAVPNSEFPFIEQKTEKGVFRQYWECTREHGQLASASMVAAAIGVSKQRVHVLIKQGRIATVKVGKRKYVPLAALELFLTEECKAGRPFKAGSLLDIAKAAVQK